MKTKTIGILLCLAASSVLAAVQAPARFSHEAQKEWIPAELGSVYLGMPLADFVQHFDFSESVVGDTRFDFVSIAVPVREGNVESIVFRVHGLPHAERDEYLTAESVRIEENGFEYTTQVVRLDASQVPPTGFVYQINVEFYTEFDLQSYATDLFGEDGTVRAPDDDYRFYDTQWTVRTSDGLLWLVRAFYEGEDNTLQLIGIIDGTEWDPDA